MTELTEIFKAMQKGDSKAAEQLLPLVYDQLRKLAAKKLAAEKPGLTLEATGLVHEAYLRLVHNNQTQHWDSKAHFYMAAAQSMQRILVENARRKRRIRHGGNFTRHDLEEIQVNHTEFREDLIALDDALQKLAVENPQAATLVQLRYFAGVTIDQASSILEISERTAARLWTFARVWLLREIQGCSNSGKKESQ